MLITLTSTTPPATDLGYLLHKHPAKVQHFNLSFGCAHLFYPEADEQRCTAALLLDLDPVALVRGRPGAGRGREAAGPLAQYVNDRPYVASSFLSVALREVLSSALAGRCDQRADLVERPMPLTARVGPLRPGGGPALVRRLFEPLGYELTLEEHEDEQLPGVRCFSLRLAHTTTVRDLLSHLYVLMPVLDDDKHYWVERDEVEKLLRHGERWLAAHPERELITGRYLKHSGRLTRLALDRLAELDEREPAAAQDDEAQEEAEQNPEQQLVEAPLSLNRRRLAAVVDLLRSSGARRVLDLGCGDGKLLRELLKEPQFETIVGVDVALRELARADERLKLDRLPERQRNRITLLHCALTYRDRRLAGFDAAAVLEVVEHLEPDRLAAFAAALFGAARPGLVLLSTPNREYNRNFPGLAAGRLRHPDHRFEWSRAEFTEWCAQVCERYGYQVSHSGIGDEDAESGHPTQLAVFRCA